MAITKKKLIEVALPLEAINAEAAREKSIRHGHPSTLHLWWARRPLAACRAVLFASLVDDPSSHPDQFPTEEAQEEERQRLFRLIERLVKWENINNEALYKEAYEEILKSTDGNPPPVLDPFAGGGSIPLEAQRLGLEAHASDLNPVAVLINKALIEIPPRFKDMAPVNPQYRKDVGNSPIKGAGALAEDVRYYGEWMRQKTFEKIGHLYPKVTVPATDTEEAYEATVIAWIWARTVKCPNPACGAEMPLVRSFELSKKKGKEAWVNPIVSVDKKSVRFKVQHGKGEIPEGTVNRNGAHCICCDEPIRFPHIRNEGKAGRISAKMMAIVADGKGGRIYLSPNDEHINTANMPKPDDYPDAPLPGNTRDIRPQLYGLPGYGDLFTPRQLTALVTFSDLVTDAIAQAKSDAINAGLPNDELSLDAGGIGARAYAEAVGVYLAIGVDKISDNNNSLCRWKPTMTQSIGMFSRQAIPMVWDYVENNIFNNSAGDYNVSLNTVCKVLLRLHTSNQGYVSQQDATHTHSLDSIVISTDPPYYDNIGYADLSDFFYIWLRRSLQNVYPKILSTILVPKVEELIATPFRFNGNADSAKKFFENGMFQTFTKMRKIVSSNFPLTVYYAFKQSETEEDEFKYDGTIKYDGSITYSGTASTGWETMLQALINAGFAITGTWPLRTEMSNRTIASNSNALASSIAIVCRPRQDDAPSTTRRAFQAELREALKAGLHDLQSGNIAPVDLAQASIGPGIAVYSKYKEVLEADGNPMSVRQALVMINQELDAYLSAQEGSLDSNSRFCIAWFEEYGLEAADYGRAETLAKAKLSHLQDLADEGMLESGRGKVRLIKRAELPENWNIRKVKGPTVLSIWAMVQGLCHAMDTGGKEKAASLMAEISKSNSGDIENIKALAYRAYMIAERKGWTEEALAYNSLVSLWSDLTSTMNEINKRVPRPQDLEF